jgi:hypothetical protein
MKQCATTVSRRTVTCRLGTPVEVSRNSRQACLELRIGLMHCKNSAAPPVRTAEPIRHPPVPQVDLDLFGCPCRVEVISSSLGVARPGLLSKGTRAVRGPFDASQGNKLRSSCDTASCHCGRKASGRPLIGRRSNLKGWWGDLHPHCVWSRLIRSRCTAPQGPRTVPGISSCLARRGRQREPTPAAQRNRPPPPPPEGRRGPARGGGSTQRQGPGQSPQRRIPVGARLP